MFRRGREGKDGFLLPSEIRLEAGCAELDLTECDGAQKRERVCFSVSEINIDSIVPRYSDRYFVTLCFVVPSDPFQ